MFTLVLSTLVLPGTAYAQDACDAEPDSVLCTAVDLAVEQGNAAFGNNVISESSPKVRLRPSTLYARLEAVQAVSAADCTAVSSWAGSYDVPAATGTTTLDETITASVKERRFAGTVDTTSFGDMYSRVKKPGLALASIGNTSVVAGYFARVAGKRGIWVGLDVDCPVAGDVLYEDWLGGLPNYNVLTCGNGVLDEGEECDDGNLLNDDSCSATCTERVCAPDPTSSGEQSTSCDPVECASLVDVCTQLCVDAVPTVEECLIANPGVPLPTCYVEFGIGVSDCRATYTDIERECVSQGLLTCI